MSSALLIWLVLERHFSSLGAAAVIVPFSVVVMLGVLQPAQGAIIALQWWLGMGGFGLVGRRLHQAQVRAA